MTTLAIHIEVADGDVDKAKTAARKLASDMKARSATVSTSDGAWGGDGNWARICVAAQRVGCDLAGHGSVPGEGRDRVVVAVIVC
jgi:hypothetical protein